VLTLARGIQWEDARAEVLTKLASCLVEFPRPILYSLWCGTPAILARRARRDLLADLRALGPVIATLGGAEAVAGTFRAIQDVGRWWPWEFGPLIH